MKIDFGLRFEMSSFFLLRGPKNVEVFDCLWAGASGLPSGPLGTPPAPAHKQSKTFTFFGPRKKNFFQISTDADLILVWSILLLLDSDNSTGADSIKFTCIIE